MQNALSFLSILLSGLITGLFYSYSCSVNPGLARLDHESYLKAMQSINKAILNPVFFMSFIGTLIVLAIAAWVQYKVGNTSACYFLSAAFVIYLIAVFGVTAAGNVPLNEALALFDIKKGDVDGWLRQRELFEAPWNRYHLIRTVGCVISFALTILSVIK